MDKVTWLVVAFDSEEAEQWIQDNRIDPGRAVYVPDYLDRETLELAKSPDTTAIYVGRWFLRPDVNYLATALNRAAGYRTRNGAVWSELMHRAC